MRLEAYTDGACSNNGQANAPGGWGYYMRALKSNGGKKKSLSEKEDSGSKLGTTNTEMELAAILFALRAIEPNSWGKCNLHIYTDSKYVKRIYEELVYEWEKTKWSLPDDLKPYRAMIIETYGLLQKFDRSNDCAPVVWHWVRGHTGHPFNTRADRLAVDAKLLLIATNEHANGSEADYAALNERCMTT